MAVPQIQNTGAEYTQLLGTVKALSEQKKLNISFFDTNNDGKLSHKELKTALSQLPNIKVNNLFVDINDYDKNGRLMKTTKKIKTGTEYSTTSYKYSQTGQKTEEQHVGPMGSSTTTFSYYPDGSLKKQQVKDKSGTIIYNYKEDGTLLNIETPKTKKK